MNSTKLIHLKVKLVLLSQQYRGSSLKKTKEENCFREREKSYSLKSPANNEKYKWLDVKMNTGTRLTKKSILND